MQASAKPKSAGDRPDFVVIPSDRVAPSDAEISDLLRAAARQHSEAGAHTAPDPNPSALVPVPTVDTTFRATNVNDNVPARGQTFGRRLMRAVAALLLAMGIGAAALTWQTFGYAAKKVLLTWVPKWAIVASLPLDKLGLGPNSLPSDTPADAAPAQADASAPAATDVETTTSMAATAPAPSPDATERLQSMARDLASANQEIETLKADVARLRKGRLGSGCRTSRQGQGRRGAQTGAAAIFADDHGGCARARIQAESVGLFSASCDTPAFAAGGCPFQRTTAANAASAAG
jgi:hypothetical protein